MRDLSKVMQQVSSGHMGLCSLSHVFVISLGVQVSPIQTFSPLEVELLLTMAAGRKSQI